MGCIIINPVALAKRTGMVIVSVAGLWFAWAFLLARLNGAEKKRLVVVAILFSRRPCSGLALNRPDR